MRARLELNRFTREQLEAQLHSSLGFKRSLKTNWSVLPEYQWTRAKWHNLSSTCKPGWMRGIWNFKREGRENDIRVQQSSTYNRHRRDA